MRVCPFFAASALSLALVTPARAEEPAPDAPAAALEAPAYPPPSARWAGMGVGLATTAFFWGAATGASYAWPDVPGARDLRLPVVGPWMFLAKSDCGDDPDCSTLLVVARGVLAAIDGLGQAGGLAVMVESAFMPTQSWSGPPGTTPGRPPPSTPKPEETKPGDKNLFFLPTPMTLGMRGMGVGIVGRF